MTTTTKLQRSRRIEIHRNINLGVLVSKSKLGRPIVNIKDLCEIGKLKYEGPRLKDKLCEGSGEVQEQANNAGDDAKVETREG